MFFPTVVGAYFVLPHRFRWVLLLTASYVFYGYWRLDYLALLVASTLVTYVLARGMGRYSTRRERLPYLLTGLVLDLGLLGVFKYAAFGAASLQSLLQLWGTASPLPVVQLALPIGISFYTFQTLSYSIDVYRGTRAPETHLGIFALYVCFFPQLVAGPIERSGNLIPQFRRRHTLQYERVASGLRRMWLGFFKKLVIADQAAVFVDAVWATPGDFSSTTLAVASYLFAFQVYCDFSGYSDIAIGAARIMGFDLVENFRRPFSAASIRELWQRWHISLSTWFRDYVYIPLGGDRVSAGRLYANLLIVFTLSGLWHGAGWTFVLWGALHGFFLVTSLATLERRNRAWAHIDAATRRWSPVAPLRLRRGLAVFLTLHLFVFSLIVFRAGTLSGAATYLQRLFQLSASGHGVLSVIGHAQLAVLLVAIALLELLQYAREHHDLRPTWHSMPRPVRWSTYYASVLVILLFGELGAREFFYFRF